MKTEKINWTGIVGATTVAVVAAIAIVLLTLVGCGNEDLDVAEGAEEPRVVEVVRFVPNECPSVDGPCPTCPEVICETVQSRSCDCKKVVKRCKVIDDEEVCSFRKTGCRCSIIESEICNVL